ncbi:YybH family protein [Flavobacterium sp.]|uniref:YybH family protein n=1 Tax=Flavobacterium sp. TaxID=239 RepID=UPI0039E2BE90
MTLKTTTALLALGMALAAFLPQVQHSAVDTKDQIANAEKAFNELVKTKGIAEGFYQFAAPEAVIKRENDTLIKGRDNIRKYYSNPKLKNASVVWKPDFIDVSKDGTMGYTYGKYVWTIKDSTGKATDYKGVFHTVWKKQTDGSWKYVWD